MGGLHNNKPSSGLDLVVQTFAVALKAEYH